MDNTLKTLLILHAICIAFNLLLSLLLWIKQKEVLYKNLFIMWLASLISFFLNGITAEGSNFIIVVGGSSIILISITVSILVSSLANLTFPLRLYACVYLISYLGTGLSYYFDTNFLYLSLPVILGSVFPQIHISLKAFLQWRHLSFNMKFLIIIFSLHTLHVLDYPFLRDDPTFAPIGFTIALIFLFLESILAPAVIVEKIAEENLSIVISMKDAFSRFVPHQFLEYLQKESIIAVKLGDNIQKNMSVLFSDIRSFTTLSESMSLQENFNFLNSYLKRMEPIIKNHNGFVDKYIGDAIMALFGGRPDDSVNAAITMLTNLHEYNQDRSTYGYVPIKIGIGIHTGELILGTIGSESRMESTVVSDAVNLAARIEGLTKMYDISLLISGQTFFSLENPAQYKVRVIDRVKVKGKEEAVTVYEVFDGETQEIQEKKLASLKAFEEAVSLYYIQEFTHAIKLFKETLVFCPNDKMAQVYTERCEHYLKVGWDETWDAVTRLDTKK